MATTLTLIESRRILSLPSSTSNILDTPQGELAPDQRVLNVNIELLTHAIKIAAFNTITAIARAIRLHTSYASAADGPYTLGRKVLTRTGDIDPRTEGELIIRLDPMPTYRETAAVAELCEHLTAARTRFPDNDRLLRYQIKPPAKNPRTSPWVYAHVQNPGPTAQAPHSCAHQLRNSGPRPPTS